MPILNIQRQMRELGRIRTGIQVDGKRGPRPSKLETFRLTSSSCELIEAAAAVYGGVATPWMNGADQEYEVVTTAAALDIVVPPGQPVSQWYEMWAGGGCLRRCDSVTNVLTMQPCLCPADVAERLALAKNGEACKATTRLNVMLPALPDLGVWRLESHSFYAAVELAGAVDVLALAMGTGRLIPARLRLEQREKKVPGQPTNRYAVPIIEFVETRMAALALEAAGANVSALMGRGQAALGAGDRPARPQLPATTLPPSSDFRAPVVDAPEVPAQAPATHAPAPAGARLCGATSPDSPATCGIAANVQHRVHKELRDGEVVQTWPAVA